MLTATISTRLNKKIRYQKFTLYDKSTMSLFLKNSSLAEAKYLPTRINKTNSYLRNTRPPIEMIEMRKAHTNTNTHIQIEKDEIRMGC